MALFATCQGLTLQTAHAAGFQLLEQNASGLGNAYAGSAVNAENASVLHYNPAAMGLLNGAQFSVGTSYIRTNATFSGSVSNNGGNAGGDAFIPNAFLAVPINADLSAGIGITVPFGLSTEYQAGWAGSDHALKTSVKTVNVNPALSYRVNDKLRIGLGLNYQKLNAEMNNSVPLPGRPVSALSGDDSSWGWNAGFVYSPSETMRLGLSYRSPMKHTLEGNSSGVVNAPIRADIKLPGVLTWSVSQQLSDRWEALGDLSYTQWNSIQSLDVYNRNTGALMSSEKFAYKNSWRIAWGANYLLDDKTKLKFGLAYDNTPTTDLDRSPRLPDGDRVWLSLGAQYKLYKTGMIDLGYSYVYVRDVDMNHYKAAASPQYLSGAYNSNSIHILGVQYSHGF